MKYYTTFKKEEYVKMHAKNTVSRIFIYKNKSLIDLYNILNLRWKKYKTLIVLHNSKTSIKWTYIYIVSSPPHENVN
jgi:hypothetical protein